MYRERDMLNWSRPASRTAAARVLRQAFGAHAASLPAHGFTARLIAQASSSARKRSLLLSYCHVSVCCRLSWAIATCFNSIVVISCFSSVYSSQCLVCVCSCPARIVHICRHLFKSRMLYLLKVLIEQARMSDSSLRPVKWEVGGWGGRHVGSSTMYVSCPFVDLEGSVLDIICVI